ncbi:MAG: hypothetical protein DWG76_00910, partial [Chloroflexi bacterium]|nr:hypothetical protein [Chloroflexota bacterium]
DAVEKFVVDMRGRGQIPEDIRMAKDANEAISEADIICAATTSSTPVFADASLKPGVHINGVGSYTSEMQEIPSESVGRALVSVDSHSAALAECGDLAIPMKMNLISKEDIHEIGEIIAGKKPGRSSENQVTFFKSVGVAAQDAVAGRLAVANARRMGLGLQVEL